MYNQPNKPVYVSEQKINVQVGANSFSIPAHKASELMNILRSWQGVALPESKATYPQYGGNTLLNG